MQINEFITQFKTYCQQIFPIETGTSTSYTNAVRYLFEFMNAYEITSALILEVRSLEPDIRDSNSILYWELKEYFTTTGRGSYLEKGFLKAALPVLYEFNNAFSSQENQDEVLLQEIRDNQIVAVFSEDRLRNELPTAEYVAHSYHVRRISGTINESVKRIYSGRKAEKYFISFLISLGFVKNSDFFDVANNKTYGYDIRFYDIGLEIKNIKSGVFFLSDNEIARLENTETHLILVDIDNGIWILKRNSSRLKRTISDIKELRAYCKTHYTNVDPCEIKILIDTSLKNDMVNISNYSKENITQMLIGE